MYVYAIFASSLSISMYYYLYYERNGMNVRNKHIKFARKKLSAVSKRNLFSVIMRSVLYVEEQ